MLTEDISAITRMTVMSHQSYGPLVGVPRILALLKRHDLRATFFIPGWTVENHRAPVLRIRHAQYVHHCGRIRNSQTQRLFERVMCPVAEVGSHHDPSLA